MNGVSVVYWLLSEVGVMCQYVLECINVCIMYSVFHGGQCLAQPLTFALSFTKTREGSKAGLIAPFPEKAGSGKSGPTWSLAFVDSLTEIVLESRQGLTDPLCYVCDMCISLHDEACVM